MNIRILVACAAALWAGTAANAATFFTSLTLSNASALVTPSATVDNRYDFVMGGFPEAATLSGHFIGTDTDEDEAIASFFADMTEVTDFAASFSGNSEMAATNFDVNSLLLLFYGVPQWNIDDDLDSAERVGPLFELLLVVPNDDNHSGTVAAITGPLSEIFLEDLRCAGCSGLVGAARFDVRGVPEPASWVLLIGGFGLVGAALRRRRLLAA